MPVYTSVDFQTIYDITSLVTKISLIYPPAIFFSRLAAEVQSPWLAAKEVYDKVPSIL